MAKSKGIIEKAKEGIEEIGEKGGEAFKSMTGQEDHKKSRTNHTHRRTRKSHK